MSRRASAAAAAKPPSCSAKASASSTSWPGMSWAWTNASAPATRCAERREPLPAPRRRRHRHGWSRRDRPRPVRPLAPNRRSAIMPSEPDAVGARRGAEHPREARACMRRRADCRPRFPRAPRQRERLTSNSAIWSGKTSRNRPEMRSVTSTRGRPSIASGRISKPLTRLEAKSQTGRTPISAKACARSSPPVRMVALAPKIEHDPPRPVAMVLRVAGQRPPRRRGGRSPRRCGSARRADRSRRGCGRSAARRGARAPARRPGRAATKRPSSAASRPRISAAPQAASALRRQRLREPPRRGASRGEAVSRAIASGELAEHMQAVADAHVLQVAEPGVERDQRRLRRLAVGARILRASPSSRARSRISRAQSRARGADRAPAPARIRRTAPRARARRHAIRRRSAAASDGRSSPRRCAAWPARPRRDC